MGEASGLYTWMYRLGAPNQYRNVPYVVGSNTNIGCIRCVLCGTGDMFRKTAAFHFNGSGHQTMYRQVRALEEEEENRRQREAYIRSVQTRVARLGHLSWRWEVKAALHDYYVQNVPTVAYAMHVLEKYERMEQLSLLELAIWKCQICDGVTFSSLQEMREYQIVDEDFDSTRFAQEMRRLGASSIIIPLVASFLPPRLYNYN
eukprot:scaffold567_cov170-Amphora_coffeaeformis.AAC.3